MAVALDAVGTVQHTALNTSVNYTNITVGAGANRALIIMIAFGSPALAPTGITLTWDSGGTNQAMTQIAFSAGTNITAGIWGLVAPTSGNKTLAVSWTNANESWVSGVCFTGVDQTGGTTSFPNAAANTGVATLTIGSAVADMGVAITTTGGVISGSTGTTLYIDNTSAAFINSSSEYQAGASPSMVIGFGVNLTTLAAVDIRAFASTQFDMSARGAMVCA